MIKILIADDHTIVREGLKQILRQTPDIRRIDEARDGEEVIQKAGKQDYDLVLLDISLPGRSGLDVLKQLKCLKPALPVLVLSMHPEEQYAIRSIRAGASGYLTKESASEELIEAIRKVAQGRRYITSSLAEKMAFQMDVDTKKYLHEALSDREYQVFCMIASGKTVKEIAGVLSLSVKTISTHRSRVLKKMDMRNNAQITHYAIKCGLVD
ncbi:MAG: response regulator transcription factor [Candidatus Aminicenantales bacterium]